MIRQWYTLIGFMIVGMMLTGCATIMTEEYQDVPVTSQPSGLRLSVDGHSYGSTPQILRLTRGETHVITVEHEGYWPYEIAVVPVVSPWMGGNGVLGGLFGAAIDSSSGRMYDYSPNHIYAFFPVMRQGQASPPPSTTGTTPMKVTVVPPFPKVVKKPVYGDARY